MSYTSQGTISMKCVVNDAGAITSATIFFVPDNNYSIKHKKKDYAIFVSNSSKTAKAIIREYDPSAGNGVEFSIDKPDLNLTGLISSVAVHQTKVEVQVKSPAARTITNITVPAR